MKKLLSAVTSIVMSTSLMTSAFASSFNVSAAGRISVEQPNVSMEDVLDVSALLRASSYPAGPKSSSFVVESGTASGKPGDTVTIGVKANSNNSDVAQIVVRLIDEDLPSGFKVVGLGDAVSWAAGESDVTTQGEFNYIDCLEGGDPIKLNDSEPVIEYQVKIPDNAAGGDYSFSLSRFTVAPNGKEVFEATINPGKITVDGPVATQAQNPATQAQNPATQAQNPATQANNPSTGGSTWDKGENTSEFIAYSGDWTADAGKNLTIGVKVDSNNWDVAQMVSRLNDRDLPAGFKVVGIGDGVSWAANEKDVTTQGEFNYIDCLEGGDPIKLNDSEPVIEYVVSVPSSASGKYDFSISRFTVATDGKHAYEAKIVPGTITINGTSATQAQNPATQAQNPATQAQNPATQAYNPSTGGSTWDKGENTSDFIAYSGDWTADAGKNLTIGIKVDSNNWDVAQMVSRLNDRDLPAGFKVVSIGDAVSWAAGE
ncbi:MAG TPA: hypothetical protein DCZ71_04345, partial [Ruminococcus sp.]|nr:hypothetical protein [Ruminococcus sp.]